MSPFRRVLFALATVVAIVAVGGGSALATTDSFSVTLPLNTDTDTLGTGQGLLETTDSEDHYTFTLGAAQRLVIAPSNCPSGDLGWELDNSGGSPVANASGCGTHLTSSLSAGTYTLRVGSQNGHIGTYTMQVFDVPPPDAFSVSLPLNTATDSLGSGAGDLETSGSEDDYTFTLGASHALELDSANCPGGFWASVHLNLVDSGGGTVASNNGCGLYRTSTLSAGTYTLKVTQPDGNAGTYDLHAFVVPAPDAFSLTLPMNTATDTLGSGQGNLETTASEDDYTFTTSATHDVEIEASSCPGFWSSLHWELVDFSGSTVTSNGCGNHLVTALAAGTYTVRVTPQDGNTGAYGLKVFVPVPPTNDDFANATSISSVSGSTTGNGSWASGETAEPHGFVRTVWFSWRAPANGAEVFTGTEAGDGARVSVFTGSAVGSLRQVSIQDGTNPVNVAKTAVARGKTYYIQLEPSEYGSWGSYELDWDATEIGMGTGAPISHGFDARGPGADPTRTRVSVGPVSVDVTSGNVFLQIPGPSFPSPAGSLGLSVAFNSLPSQATPARPPSYQPGGGACGPSIGPLCHAPRDYSDGSRTAPGLGEGFSLNLSADSVPMELIDHSALAPDPAPVSGEDDASTDPVLAAAEDYVEVVSGDGSSRMFQHQPGTNEWLPAGISLVSSQSGPNQMPTPDDQTDGARLEKDPSPGSGDPTWTLVDADGTTATFGPVGSDGKSRIWSVQEQTKASTAASSLARLEYTYTAGTSGTLYPTAINEEPSGRSLNLVWNDLNSTGCASAILCVTGPDGQTWRYVGDGSGGTSGQLVSVSDGTRVVLGLGWTSGELTSVKSADDLDPSNASAGYNTTHKITVAYAGTHDRASTLTDYDLSEQGSTVSHTWAFSYTDLDGTAGANGCGAFDETSFAHSTSYYGDSIAAGGYRTGCRRWTHVVANGGPAWDYITDMAGQLMELRPPNGNGYTLFEHAPDGRLLWSEDGNGQPTDYTYDGTTGQLLTIRAPDPDGSGPLGRPTTSYRYNETKIGTSSTAGPQLTGLKAEWYANQTLSGIPKTTTWSQTSGGILDENWSTTGPSALGSPSSDWSARFSGTITLPTTGDYHFQLSVDDGAQVLIDDQPVVGDWTTGSVRTVTGDPISLDAGSHRIVVEYFQGSTSSSELHLSWEKPGDTSYSLIPYDQVAPNYGLQTSTVSPEGEVNFSHYADPESGQPDYTQSGGSLRLVNSFTYDGLGRILTRVQPKGNASRTIASDGALGGSPNSTYETDYTYYSDSATAAPPSGCPSGSAVNQAGQLETISRAGYADQTSVYDAAGNTVAFTKGKGTTCSTYDAEGRLVSQRVPGDSTISGCSSDSSATACYTYDPSGLKRSARTANGEVDLAYNEDGNVIKSTQKDASGTVFGESTISYDGFGDPYHTVVAAGPLSSATNYTFQTHYDEMHHLQDAGIVDGSGGYQEQGSYGYDPAGHLTDQQDLDVGLGIYTMLTYDNDGNITGAHTRHGEACSYPCSIPSDSAPFADYTYTHDQDGRITSQTLTGDGLTSATTNYTYDAASRLATAELPSGLVRTYHYDDDSNRTSIDEQPSGGSLATVATYAYSTSAQDRLSTVTNSSSTTTYSYDTDGETLTYGTNALTWNGNDQIATDDPTSSSTVAYSYDPLGRLQDRTTTGPTADNEYIYAGTSDTPIMTTDGAGTITESDLNGPLGTRRLNHGPPLVSGGPPGTSDLLFPDGLGNQAGTINLSSTGTNTYTYDAFGTPDQTTPTNTLTNRWVAKFGRSLDTQTGLILMGARPYDSTVGRFLSTDAVEGGSANLYDYTDQNPLNTFDPEGTNGGPPCSLKTPACKKYLNAIHPKCKNCQFSVEVNFTVAFGHIGPIQGGVTVGGQIGSGGVAVYGGSVVGRGLSASVSASPSAVNLGVYKAYAACVGDALAGCVGGNSRGNVSVGVGVGTSAAIENRHAIGYRF